MGVDLRFARGWSHSGKFARHRSQRKGLHAAVRREPSHSAIGQSEPVVCPCRDRPRRCAFSRALRRGSCRYRPRGHGQLGGGRRPSGRKHTNPAIGAQQFPARRAKHAPQNSRGRAGLAYGSRPLQGRNSHELHEPHLFRSRPVRYRNGGAELFRQAGGGFDFIRIGTARRPHPQPQPLVALPRSRWSLAAAEYRPAADGGPRLYFGQRTPRRAVRTGHARRGKTGTSPGGLGHGIALARAGESAAAGRARWRRA